MRKIISIENLSSSSIRSLAIYEHDRITRATSKRDLTESELDFEISYSSFVYNGSRNIPFIRKALIALRNN